MRYSATTAPSDLAAPVATAHPLNERRHADSTELYRRTSTDRGWSGERSPTQLERQLVVGRLTSYIRTEGDQRLDEALVTTVDVVHVGHLGDALGDQTGKDECGTGADVVGAHRCSGQPLAAAHDGVMSVGADVGP